MSFMGFLRKSCCEVKKPVRAIPKANPTPPALLVRAYLDMMDEGDFQAAQSMALELARAAREAHLDRMLRKGEAA